MSKEITKHQLNVCTRNILITKESGAWYGLQTEPLNNDLENMGVLRFAPHLMSV